MGTMGGAPGAGRFLGFDDMAGAEKGQYVTAL